MLAAVGYGPGVPRTSRRTLGLLTVTALGINTIVGSGIFRFPSELALELGPASIITFLVCAAMLAIVGLCFAELGGMIEKDGGIYAYAYAAFGPAVGYAIGWSAWVSTVLSLAAVAVAIPGQLAEIAPWLSGAGAAKALAAGVVIALGALNFAGRGSGAFAVNALVIVKLAALIGFVAVGAFFVEPQNLVPFAPHGYTPLVPAMLFAFFALSGFETSAVPGAETKHASRNIPIAVVGSLIGAAVLYTAIQLVAVGVLPTLIHSQRPLADATRVFLGDGGAWVMSLAGAVSMLGLCAAMAFAAPRFLVALGEDGQLHAKLAAWSGRSETPRVAIAIGTLLAALLALTLDFRALVDFTSVTLLLQYTAACVAVVVLRRRWPARARTWRTPLSPALPLLGALSLGGVLLLSEWQQLAAAALLIAVGFVFRWGRSVR